MIPKVGISEGKEPLFYNESHHAWREEVRKFVSKEIAPFVEEWEEAGQFPAPARAHTTAGLYAAVEAASTQR